MPVLPPKPTKMPQYLPCGTLVTKDTIRVPKRETTTRTR